jgi:hypothetical protein
MLPEGTKVAGRMFATMVVEAMTTRIGKDGVIETFLKVCSTRWG